LKPWSLRPPMSVTRPTLNEPPAAAPPLAELELDALPALELLLLLLELLPHAATASVSTAAPRAGSPKRLMGPFTRSPLDSTKAQR